MEFSDRRLFVQVHRESIFYLGNYRNNEKDECKMVKIDRRRQEWKQNSNWYSRGCTIVEIVCLASVVSLPLCIIIYLLFYFFLHKQAVGSFLYPSIDTLLFLSHFRAVMFFYVFCSISSTQIISADYATSKNFINLKRNLH